LLLGIVISLAVALWLNRLSNPFVDKARRSSRCRRSRRRNRRRPPDAAEGRGESRARARASAPSKAAGEAGRAPALRVLPDPAGRQGGRRARSAKARRPAPRAPPRRRRHTPGSSPALPKPALGRGLLAPGRRLLEEREADNLKARIALTGLEATVRAVPIPDKGTLYRVRLGPYQSLDDANRNKATLSQNGVGTAIIRTTDEARNP
jgi:cell division septation protein DedD